MTSGQSLILTTQADYEADLSVSIIRARSSILTQMWFFVCLFCQKHPHKRATTLQPGANTGLPSAPGRANGVSCGCPTPRHITSTSPPRVMQFGNKYSFVNKARPPQAFQLSVCRIRSSLPRLSRGWLKFQVNCINTCNIFVVVAELQVFTELFCCQHSGLWSLQDHVCLWLFFFNQCACARSEYSWANGWCFTKTKIFAVCWKCHRAFFFCLYKWLKANIPSGTCFKKRGRCYYQLCAKCSLVLRWQRRKLSLCGPKFNSSSQILTEVAQERHEG